MIALLCAQRKYAVSREEHTRGRQSHAFDAPGLFPRRDELDPLEAGLRQLGHTRALHQYVAFSKEEFDRGGRTISLNWSSDLMVVTGIFGAVLSGAAVSADSNIRGQYFKSA